MSNAVTNAESKPDKMHLGTRNLSRGKIQQLLACVGSKPRGDTTEIETTEYNWQQPHHFNSAQRDKLGDFAKRMARAAAEKVSSLCHEGFNVTASSITEHFAQELIDQTLGSEENDYYLAFRTNQEQRPAPRRQDNTNSPDAMGEAHLLILCDHIEPVVGRTAEAVRGLSSEEISRTIFEHLQQMSVSVTAQLGPAMLTFEEIMNLQVGDILLLDRRIDEPIGLTVGGRTILLGQPAKSTGNYAFVVTGDTKSVSAHLRNQEASYTASKSMEPN